MFGIGRLQAGRFVMGNAEMAKTSMAALKEAALEAADLEAADLELADLEPADLEVASSAPGLLEALKPIAEQFEVPGAICQITPLGEGNVNDTFLVSCQGDTDQHFVLQRINTTVFPRPDLVMNNMVRLSAHANSKLVQPGNPLSQTPWITPQPISTRESGDHWLEQDGQVWRLITYVNGARTLQTLEHHGEARQVGRALGLFHSLLSDLEAQSLADTLPGFHVTPTYLKAYYQTLEQVIGGIDLDQQPHLSACLEFIRQREHELDILENALQQGELVARVIHGDPKVNNIMLCSLTGTAIAMVDLDTVKPGLVHYDIGDCCRSGCNRAGEETTNLDLVIFDLEFCEAILDGYLTAAKGTLTPQDFDYLFAAIRLIPLELGLRFLTDHLAGDRYFKVKRPGHNLDRARVQFKLTESIEEQEDSIRAIIERLRHNTCP